MHTAVDYLHDQACPLLLQLASITKRHAALQERIRHEAQVFDVPPPPPVLVLRRSIGDRYA